jgi:hypothetical protein
MAVVKVSDMNTSRPPLVRVTIGKTVTDFKKTNLSKIYK